jgi:hypothetical protein
LIADRTAAALATETTSQANIVVTLYVPFTHRVMFPVVERAVRLTHLVLVVLFRLARLVGLSVQLNTVKAVRDWLLLPIELAWK